MAFHSQLAFVFLVLADFVHSFDLSTCNQDSIWFTYPVPREVLLAWMKHQLGDTGMKELALETPDEYGDQHPVQIEFDTNTKCSSMKFLPYPDFQEIVVQIPYVRFRGKLIRFQPWALVDNIPGEMAMALLGSGHKKAQPFTVSYGPSPAIWNQVAEVSGNTAFQVSAEVKDVPVTNFQPHVALQQKDKVWREFMDTKMATFVGHTWTGYCCSQIAYNLASTQVAPISNGTVNITGNGQFLPVDIHTSVKGLRAYAVRTQFTVKLNSCPREESDAKEGKTSSGDMFVV
jgi:hypothetical protein